MKSSVWILLFALVAPLVRADATPPSATAAAAAAGGLRYTIGVTKFENHSGFAGEFNLSDTWGAILTDSLQQTGRFIVLGEADMRNAAMGEQDFAKSGRTAGGDKAPVTGQMSPAQLLIKGEITHFQAQTQGGGGGIGIKGFRIGASGDQAEINVVIYVVDSTTGQVVASKRVVGVAKNSGLSLGFANKDWGADLGGFKKTNVGKAVEAAIDQGVAFIVSQIQNLPWTGTVILTKGNQVWINRGAREGVQAGQTFKVGTTEVLRDPNTGETLDTSMTVKGEIKVDTVREKVAICSIVSGSGIDRGMGVSLP